MKKNFFLALIAVLAIGGILFFSCKKEEVITPKSVTVKQAVDPDLLQAYLIIENVHEHLMNAYTKDQTTFVALCKDQNYEALIGLMGYDKASWERLNEDLKVATTSFLDTHPELANMPKGSSCSTCTLENLPQITEELIIERDSPTLRRPKFDWIAAALCLSSCLSDCIGLIEFPALYAVCTGACTAICYGLSTASVAANVSAYQVNVNAY